MDDLAEGRMYLTLIAAVYAITSGGTSDSRMVFKTCTEGATVIRCYISWIFARVGKLAGLGHRSKQVRVKTGTFFFGSEQFDWTQNTIRQKAQNNTKLLLINSVLITKTISF